MELSITEITSPEVRECPACHRSSEAWIKPEETRYSTEDIDQIGDHSDHRVWLAMSSCPHCSEEVHFFEIMTIYDADKTDDFLSDCNIPKTSKSALFHAEKDGILWLVEHFYHDAPGTPEKADKTPFVGKHIFGPYYGDIVDENVREFLSLAVPLTRNAVPK